jgi:hypothetical protein
MHGASCRPDLRLSCTTRIIRSLALAWARVWDEQSGRQSVVCRGEASRTEPHAKAPTDKPRLSQPATGFQMPLRAQGKRPREAILKALGHRSYYSPDAATTQNTSITIEETGACHRRELGRQTPATPNTIPATESSAPHLKMRSSIGS